MARKNISASNQVNVKYILHPVLFWLIGVDLLWFCYPTVKLMAFICSPLEVLAQVQMFVLPQVWMVKLSKLCNHVLAGQKCNCHFKLAHAAIINCHSTECKMCNVKRIGKEGIIICFKGQLWMAKRCPWDLFHFSLRLWLIVLHRCGVICPHIP